MSEDGRATVVIAPVMSDDSSAPDPVIAIHVGTYIVYSDMLLHVLNFLSFSHNASFNHTHARHSVFNQRKAK